jgi:Zinc dependent phospholipase C
MISLLFALVALLFFPHDALAWGSGIHLQIGSAVLKNLPALRPAVAAIIGAYPFDYLYGCIAADITIGKKFTHYLLHCHRWQMGLRVLEHAETEPQRACAYGYLSHLAADTIAHNYYVPYKLMMSYSSITLKHTYWEMRFETFVERDTWDVGKKVVKEHFKGNDLLLSRVLSDTLFSFGTNKRIFNSILLLSRFEKWQQVSRTFTGASRYALTENDREEYMELAREAVFDFLSNMEESRAFLADPTGERALAAAETVRKNFRTRYLTRKITRKQATEQLKELKPRLRSAIWQPENLLEILSAEDEQSVALKPVRKKRGSVLI